MAAHSKASWRRTEAVIDALLQEFDPAQPLDEELMARATVLCEGDEEVLREVFDLLARMRQEDLLEAGLDRIAPGLLAEVEGSSEAWSSEVQGSRSDAEGSDARPPGAGRRIDRYRTLEILGRGGMGVVYRAERADGTFDKEVALKVLPLGLDTPEAVRRFRRERQILARLEHPNIARLLDGGVTEDGSPYLVMELVDGRPIDDFCQEHDLSVRERVELFLQVCDAVRYAHRNLVVHRDLKPSNCLVTSGGVVKLLDFGIGKILEEDAFGSEPGTVVQPMTPSYASPEQLANQPVSIASDVYSLGLLLYRVLSGSHPFDTPSSSRARATAHDRSTMPVAPSQRLADGSGVRNSADVARLRRELRGDLDVVVLESLRPNPEQRTGSVEDLRDDLQRWLEGRPIAARPISRTRRVGKFLLRHRAATAASLLVLVLAATGVTGIATQGRIAARERDRARVEAARSQRVVGFLTGVLQASSADARGSGERTARELLDEAEGRIRVELRDDPVVLAAMLDVMALSYISFSEDERALALAEEAVELLQRLQPEAPQQLARSWITLANIRAGLGRTEGLEGLLEQALVLLEQEGRSASEAAASAHRELGSLYRRSGRPEESLDFSRRAMEISAQLGHVATAAIDGTRVASTLAQLGRLDESLKLNRAALAVFVEQYGEGHPNTTSTRNNIANALMGLGRPVEAEALYRAGYEAEVEVFGADNRRVGTSLANLSRALLMQGRGDEAQRAAERAVELLGQGLDPNHPSLAGARMNLASALAATGQLDRAEVIYREGLSRFEQTTGPGSAASHRVRSLLGAVLVEKGQLDEAERLLETALDSQVQLSGEDTPRSTGETLLTLSHLRARQDRCGEALERLQEAWPILGAQVPEESPSGRRRRAIETLCPVAIDGVPQ